MPLTTPKHRFPEDGNPLPPSPHPPGPSTKPGPRLPEEARLLTDTASRCPVKVYRCLQLWASQMRMSLLRSPEACGEEDSGHRQAPPVCPHPSPTPRAHHTLPGTCRRRRWPCRVRGCYGRGAAPPHPSWLVGSHEASVHSPHSLTPREERYRTGVGQAGDRPPHQGQHGAMGKVLAPGLSWLSHWERLDRSPHLLSGSNDLKGQSQAQKRRERKVLWGQWFKFFLFLLRGEDQELNPRVVPSLRGPHPAPHQQHGFPLSCHPAPAHSSPVAVTGSSQPHTRAEVTQKHFCGNKPASKTFPNPAFLPDQRHPPPPGTTHT